VRALKTQLENDNGSIFRCSNHENTFLNMNYRQLQADQREIEDREELCAFIRSITQAVKDSMESRVSTSKTGNGSKSRTEKSLTHTKYN
jgi:hypothetical protein